LEKKKFNILSIDGGGIRGVFPAMFLANLEAELKGKWLIKTHIYEHFQLITGASTGGIIAIALALSMPALEMYHLYLNNAQKIFGKKEASYSPTGIRHMNEYSWKT